MAIFASAPVALGMAYIGDVVPLEERQATIARFIAGSLFGQTLGPLFGGVLHRLGRAGALLRRARRGLRPCVAACSSCARAARWPRRRAGALPAARHARAGSLRAPPVRWLLVVGVAETFFFFGAYVFLGAYLRDRFDLSFTVDRPDPRRLRRRRPGLFVARALASCAARRARPGGRSAACSACVFFAADRRSPPHWRYAVPCTFGLGLAFYLMHNTIQTKATEVAPDARGSAVALYASAWAVGPGRRRRRASASRWRTCGYAPSILAVRRSASCALGLLAAHQPLARCSP